MGDYGSVGKLRFPNTRILGDAADADTTSALVLVTISIAVFIVMGCVLYHLIFVYARQQPYSHIDSTMVKDAQRNSDSLASTTAKAASNRSIV
mmetsp:Transcript_9473/g.15514  ORF Transcript_9473/g.15514 Transcript_9473/m.15514 type:complete len:93 (+) Transcript_9473:1476-1754(+)